MAEKSIFWDTGSTGDGASQYTESELFSWLRRSLVFNTAAQGVLRGYAGELAVTGTSSPLTVASGGAYVNGIPYDNSASVNVAVSTPVVGTTGHRIVLRANYSAQTVRITLLSSADGVSSIPAMTQTDGTTWDIPLATLTITTGGVITVTDARTYVQFNTNHVRRDGDTMTGGLTVNAASPFYRLTESDAPTNEGIYDLVGSAGKLILRTINDALSTTDSVLEVDRNGVTVTQINFPVEDGVLQRDGNKVWDAGNDGSGSGLDADTLDGVQLTSVWQKTEMYPLRRQGQALSDAWGSPGTDNETPTNWRQQIGVAGSSGSAASSGSASVTFPTAFKTGSTPIVFIFAWGTNGGTQVFILTSLSAISETGFSFDWVSVSGGSATVRRFYWQAFGPAV